MGPRKELLLAVLPLLSLLTFGLGPAQAPQQPGPSLLTAPQRDTGRTPLDDAAVSVSADGRYVAFASYARLSPLDTNFRSDVYVLDRLTGEITLESVGPGGTSIATDSTSPRISGDGHLVVFETIRVEGGPPRSVVVLKNRVSGNLQSVSRGAHGEAPDNWSRAPTISQDGRVVAFVSSATNLVDGPDENDENDENDANREGEDVYVFDAATGVVRRISVTDSGIQLAEGASFAPSLSADGRFVAFVSSADLDGRSGTRAIESDPRKARRRLNVYLRDLEAHRTQRISTGDKGRLPNGPSFHPSISGNGRYVVFASDASNLVPGDTNGDSDIFLRDVQEGSTVLISRSAERRGANGPSVNPAISADGRCIAFQSEASNLICSKRCAPPEEDINLVWDVFVFDRVSHVMIRASTDPGAGWMEPSGGAALDATGQVLAFSSLHPTDGRDLSHDLDLFVRISQPGASPAVNGNSGVIPVRRWNK